ncbi:MAG TPA: DUF4974 domain-containing protein [Cyclobacteriaceae bacterium]|nr:DUF4974 domain-containing protein [Cyclobacteriaceae bacterium]
MEDREGFNDGLSKIWARIRRNDRRRKRIRILAGGVLFLAAAILVPYVLSTRNDRREMRSHSFDHVLLEQVVAVLREEYGVRVDVSNDQLLGCPFTGTFYGTNMAVDLIRSLAEALDLKVEVAANGGYRLSGGGCAK